MGEVIYSGTVSSEGDFITTTVPNQEFYFYDPYDTTKKVILRQIMIEGDAVPFHFHINDEYNLSTNTGTKHKVYEYGIVGFDSLNITKITIHESGSTLMFTGLF